MRVGRLILCVALLVFVFAAFARAAEVVVVCDQQFAPYSYVETSGEPKGFLIDLWRLWSEKTGISVRFGVSDFEGAVQAVRRGEADIHSGMFANQIRAEWFDFSSGLHRASSGLFVPAGSNIHTLADAASSAVGAIDGSVEARTLVSVGADVRMYPTAAHLVHEAENGRIKAFAAERGAMLSYLGANGQRDDFVLLEQPLYFQALVAAVKKGRHDLLSRVNHGLSLISDQERRALEDRWGVVR